MTQSSIRYEYADGSANRYIITLETLEYVPVKPAESSTGFYSGGEPATVKITKEQFQSLQQQFDNAIKKTEWRTEHRAKGTAVIVRITQADTTHIIIQQGVPAKASIESELKHILQ